MEINAKLSAVVREINGSDHRHCRQRLLPQCSQIYRIYMDDLNLFLLCGKCRGQEPICIQVQKSTFRLRVYKVDEKFAAVSLFGEICPTLSKTARQIIEPRLYGCVSKDKGHQKSNSISYLATSSLSLTPTGMEVDKSSDPLSPNQL